MDGLTTFAPDEAAADAPRKVLVFETAGRLFAIPLDRLEEIVEDLAVTPVPRTPPFFLGLGNLRGGIVPLLDVRGRLGWPAADDRPRRYVLVRANQAVTGLAVDRVRGMLAPGDFCAEPLPRHGDLGLRRGFAALALHTAADGAVILGLDVDALCRVALATREGTAPAASRFSPSATGQAGDAARAAGRGDRLFSFEAAGARLALPLETLRRIMPYTPPAAPPDRGPGLLGLVCDKERLVPVFDPKVLLDAGESAPCSGQRPGFILLLDLAGHSVGLAVDRLDGILDWPGDDAARAAAREPEALFLDVVGDGGPGGPVFVLCPESLFGRAARDAPQACGEGTAAAIGAPPSPEAVAPSRADGDACELFIRFGVGDETLALPMECLREVSPVEAIVPVPRVPDAVAGLLNLRGTIIPAMNLRTRLGLPGPPAGTGRGEQARILVTAMGGQLCGLVVDRVLRPLRLGRGAIGPVPETCLSGRGPRFVRGVAKAEDGRPVLILDAASVIGTGVDDQAARERRTPDAAVRAQKREDGHAHRV